MAKQLFPLRDTFLVLSDVADERQNQIKQWGIQSLADGTGGEWKPAADEAKRINAERFDAGVGTWGDVLLEEVFESMAESDPARLRAELVQVAEVAVAWIEDIDRKVAEAEAGEGI